MKPGEVLAVGRLMGVRWVVGLGGLSGVRVVGVGGWLWAAAGGVASPVARGVGVSTPVARGGECCGGWRLG